MAKNKIKRIWTWVSCENYSLIYIVSLTLWVSNVLLESVHLTHVVRRQAFMRHRNDSFKAILNNNRKWVMVWHHSCHGLLGIPLKDSPVPWLVITSARGIGPVGSRTRPLSKAVFCPGQWGSAGCWGMASSWTCTPQGWAVCFELL